MYDLETIVGCVSNPLQVTWCHSDHFGPHFNPFRPFSMFLYYFRCFLAYIWLIATLKDYLCISHTVVYLSDVFPTLSDLLQSLFIFALINVPMFWLFLMVDRFHWLWCYYMFRLQSLWTISHIQTLWRHFDPSNVTTTYTLPTTPILNRNTSHFIPKTS